MERSASGEGAAARWLRLRSASGAGGTLRALCAAGLARRARATPHAAAAPDHWYRGYSTDSAECLPFGKSWTPIKIRRHLNSKSMIKIN